MSIPIQDLNEIRNQIAKNLVDSYEHYLSPGVEIQPVDNGTKKILVQISDEIRQGKTIISDYAKGEEIKIRKTVCSMLKEYIDDEEINFKAKNAVVQTIIYRHENFEKHLSRFQNYMKFAYSVIKTILKFGGAALLLALISVIINEKFNPQSSETSASSQQHQTYDQILQENFPLHFETLSYLGSQMELPDNDRKVITLIIASNNNEKIERFLQNFIPLTKKFFPFFTHSESAASAEMQRQELFSFASKNAEKNDGNSILIIKNIDLLKSDTPLALQTIAEVDDPRFQKSFAIFTVILDDEEEEHSFDQSCKEMIRRHIENRWSNNNLPDGKLAAIMSRISEDCICLN